MAWAREQSGELRGGEAKQRTIIDAEHTDLIWRNLPGTNVFNEDRRYNHAITNCLDLLTLAATGNKR